MARPKKTLKAKEPIKLRSRVIANGNRTLYLDKYVKGVREYQYLKLYLVPVTDEASKLANENTLKAANAIKAVYQKTFSKNDYKVKNEQEIKDDLKELGKRRQDDCNK